MNRTQLAAEAIRRKRGIYNPDDLAEAPVRPPPLTEEEIAMTGEPYRPQMPEMDLSGGPSDITASDPVVRRGVRTDPPSAQTPIHVEALTPEILPKPMHVELQTPEILPTPADIGGPRAAVAKMAMAAQPQPVPQTQLPPQAPPRPPVDLRDSNDLYDAQEADRRSHLTAGMELAARQLVGGITRTDVPQGIGAAPSRVDFVQKQATDRRKAVADAIARQRQARLDDSTVALQKSEVDKNNREKPNPKAGEAESLRELLLSPVYSDALKQKGVSPQIVAGMGEAGLKDLITQMRTDTTNTATVEAGRASAAISADRAHSNAKDMEIFKNELPKNMPPEFVDQLQGLKGSAASLDQFEANLAKTSGSAGKAGAALANLGASQGLFGKDAEAGSTFEADRERTAIALARGLEGGMARPGNVEIIQRILPHADDSESVKKQKVNELRTFMESKKQAFSEAMRGGNYKPAKASRLMRLPSVDGRPGEVVEVE